jgi:hypothetical protein
MRRDFGRCAAITTAATRGKIKDIQRVKSELVFKNLNNQRYKPDRKPLMRLPEAPYPV